MLTNPLIIATVAGLLVKASGLTVPQTATTFLAHLGNDSLAMGLLCIGAGLRLHDFRDHLALITTSVACRLWRWQNRISISDTRHASFLSILYFGFHS